MIGKPDEGYINNGYWLNRHLLFCRKNCLMVKKLICGVKYVLTT